MGDASRAEGGSRRRPPTKFLPAIEGTISKLVKELYPLLVFLIIISYSHFKVILHPR